MRDRARWEFRERGLLWWASFVPVCAALVACGASSDGQVEPVDAGEVLSCGVTPAACLSVPVSEPDRPSLMPGVEAFTTRPDAAAYAKPEQLGCDKQYVLELTSDELVGTDMVVHVTWNGAALPGPVDCDQYTGVVEAYGRADAGSPWRLIDYRTFSAIEESGNLACTPVVASDGQNGPDFPFHEATDRLWFKPQLHQAGLRVVAGMFKGCEPLPLEVEVAEAF